MSGFGEGEGELVTLSYPKPLPMRLDRWLVAQRPEQSRARIQKFIDAGYVRVNGVTGKAKTPLRQSDRGTVDAAARVIQLGVGPAHFAGGAMVDEFVARQSVNVPAIRLNPGHIAKTEKALHEASARVDLVRDVRDAPIPCSTGHPRLQRWIIVMQYLLLLNLSDMLLRRASSSGATDCAAKPSSCGCTPP